MQLPDDFLTGIRQQLDGNLVEALLKGLNQNPPVSVRLNPLKTKATLQDMPMAETEVPWCRGGYYLKQRLNFTFDPLLHAGLYYVQEASSMFLDQVMRQYIGTSPVTMLDMCAAPGGKSTVARAALPEGSLLFSNEPLRPRAQVLAENMQKFGHPDVIVTNNYAQDYAKSGIKFDVILTDVPCSGEGMFRKDPAAISEWSLQNVEKCWTLQRDIVEALWNCLKPGGLLIYSTCTFNTKEDELNVKHIAETFGAEVLTVNTEAKWHISGSQVADFPKPVCRFIPGLSKGEGLFMAVLKKPGSSEPQAQKAKDKKARRNKTERNKANAIKPDMGWIKDADNYQPVVNGTAVTAIPKAWKSVYDAAASTLKIMSAGIKMGEIKGKDIIPTQALALSTALQRDAFTQVELNYSQAIAYLRKESITLPAGTPRGYALLCYRKHPIGFAKNIGNRANNLYPNEWKIKSSHIPESNNELF